MELQVPRGVCSKVQKENPRQPETGNRGEDFKELCEWKDVEIIEAEVCPGHMYMLVAIPPKLSVSSFMGYLKGKAASNCMIRFRS